MESNGSAGTPPDSTSRPAGRALNCWVLKLSANATLSNTPMAPNYASAPGISALQRDRCGGQSVPGIGLRARPESQTRNAAVRELLLAGAERFAGNQGRPALWNRIQLQQRGAEDARGFQPSASRLC